MQWFCNLNIEKPINNMFSEVEAEVDFETDS
jgi:hypothetical protein